VLVRVLKRRGVTIVDGLGDYSVMEMILVFPGLVIIIDTSMRGKG